MFTRPGIGDKHLVSDMDLAAIILDQPQTLVAQKSLPRASNKWNGEPCKRDFYP